MSPSKKSLEGTVGIDKLYPLTGKARARANSFKHKRAHSMSVYQTPGLPSITSMSDESKDGSWDDGDESEEDGEKKEKEREKEGI